MKTERRHELETNQLANSLGHWADAVRPYINTILVSILLVVVGTAVYAVAQRRTAAGTAAAWDEYFAALSRVDRLKLEDLGDINAGTSGRLVVAVHGGGIGAERGKQRAFPRQGIGPRYSATRGRSLPTGSGRSPRSGPGQAGVVSVWRVCTSAWARSRRPKKNIRRSPANGTTLPSRSLPKSD